MADDAREGTPGEVFLAFLKLGLTSFGGPIAHLGFFRDELVTRRRWISDQGYADLVALCQFLPGPASSQVGFAMGLHRAGMWGALAAWTAFTLPSAIILVVFASSLSLLDGDLAQGALHGLKIVAVAVVAQAVWGMARTLTPDRPRAAIALVALLIVVLNIGVGGQVSAILIGAAAGLVLCRSLPTSAASAVEVPLKRSTSLLALASFALLLVLLPFVAAATGSHAVALFDAFYRAGALVFGGGHVVLPLLDAETVGRGWIGEETFLAGYGLAQAVPGPLFTFAAFIGAAGITAPNGVLGAVLALLAIFLPGLLILVGALPFWSALSVRPMARAAMHGANAAVVGILGAALYDPVWTSAILSPLDFAMAAIGFILLVQWKMAPWLVVTLLAVAGAALGLF